MSENILQNIIQKKIEKVDKLKKSLDLRTLDELIDKNNTSYRNVSTFSITPLKRSNSATASPSDHFVGGIDPPNEEIKEKSSITQENGYPAAKKSKL